MMLNMIKMRCLFLLFLLALMNCGSRIQINEELKKALSDPSITQRGNIVKLGESNFRLDYYDPYEKDSHVEYLTSRGYQGGGPSWSGIIYGGLKISEPKILNKVRFDDEADGLAIWSSEKDSLEKIGRLIFLIKQDQELMESAIEIAKKNFKME